MKPLDLLLKLRKTLPILIICFLAFYQTSAGDLSDKELSSMLASQLTNTAFIENTGQQFESCSFFARPASAFVFVMDDGSILYSSRAKGNVLATAQNVREYFEGASNYSITPYSEKEAYTHEYKRNGDEILHYKSRKYELLEYRDIYSGISMDLAISGNSIEKLFFISPFADPSQICIGFDNGVPQINDNGELVIGSEDKQLLFSKPFAYQVQNGTRQIVDVEYVINDNTYGFKLGAYDPSLELIIDPLLAGTYLGGYYGTSILDMALDAQGNVYVTGNIWLPPDSNDVFVFKLNNTLTTILEDVYIYGSWNESGHAIALDPWGDILVTGVTKSPDYPVNQGCYDLTYNGYYDLFVSKISSDFEWLLASTYLGGTENDGTHSVNLDMASNGNVWIAADTRSTDMPIVGNAYQPTHPSPGYEVAYIAQLDNSLMTVLSSTYFGGQYSDGVYALKVAPNGNIIFGGYTWSDNFPHTEGSRNDAPDAYISMLSPDLSQMISSKFLGGSATATSGYTWEYTTDIAIDQQFNIYVLGETMANDFQPITSGVFQPTFGGGAHDFFLIKFNQNLVLQKATYFGGGGDEFSLARASCALSSNNRIYMAGCTYSNQANGFPLGSASYDVTYNGSGDGFVSCLDANLNTLVASSFYGGSKSEIINDVQLDANGDVFVCGNTISEDLPTTPNGWAPNKIADPNIGEAFVAKFDPLITADPTGMHEISRDQEEYSLVVYPNPCRTHTQISFTLEAKANVDIRVLDINGRCLLQPVSATLDVGDYNYTLHLHEKALNARQSCVIDMSVNTDGQLKNVRRKLQILSE